MVSRVRSLGFTLLEILVVMVIIGIIAAMATLSIGVATSQKGTEKEIERIQDLLALASEEAVLQGREFGLTFYTKGYVFSTYDPADGHWKPLGNDAEPFNSRPFPPETIVDLEIEGRIVKLSDEKPVEKKVEKPKDDEAPMEPPRMLAPEKDKNTPQVFMMSSGDITAFSLHLRPSIGSPGINLQVAESGTVEQIRDEH